MAIAVEGTPTQANEAGSASITWSHTCGGNGLFVGGASAANTAASTCTYNSASMDEIWDGPGVVGTYRVCGYLMVNPTAGANNVVLTFAASNECWGGAVGLSGMETSSVANAHRTVYTDQGDDTDEPTITDTDSQNGDLVISNVICNELSMTSGQTSQVETDNLHGSGFSVGISTAAAVGGNTVMNWDTPGTCFYEISATALKAAAGGGGGPAMIFTGSF